MTFLKEVFLFAFSALLCLVLGVLLMDKVIMPLAVSHGEEVEVPDIVELTLQEAQQSLSQKGFSLIVEDRRPAPDVPEGQIISQTPRAFSKVKRRRRIYVVVSEGERMYEVPDVSSGISLRQARLLIAQNHLEVGTVIYSPSYEIQKDVVISQNPAPYDSVPRDVLIDLVVSSGPPQERIKMPDLIGADFEDAKFILGEKGLELGEVEFKPNADYLPNTVIGQWPKAETEVKRGEVVDLVVSEL